MTKQVTIPALLLATTVFTVLPTQAGTATSLDVCDALGLSGLTISSDTNCLQISGGVSFEFTWGDYEAVTDPPSGALFVDPAAGAFTIPRSGPALFGGEFDWQTTTDTYLKFTGTSASSFGPAQAVIKLKSVYDIDGWGPGGFVIPGPDDTGDLILDEAYISIGDPDGTIFHAGKKGTVGSFGNDEPLNYLGLFNSESVDAGVAWDPGILPDGGTVIQGETELAWPYGPVRLSGGLENIDDGPSADAGTALGSLTYSGDAVGAHLTVAAGGVLDGTVENWGFHSGVSGSFDTVKFVAAAAGSQSGYFNALGSISATFDILTLAFSAEAMNGGDFGAGSSLAWDMDEDTTIKLGARTFVDSSGGPSGTQVAAAATRQLTDEIAATGKVGAYVNDAGINVFYGGGDVTWDPAHDFTAAAAGEAYTNGAFKVKISVNKSFTD